MDQVEHDLLHGGGGHLGFRRSLCHRESGEGAKEKGGRGAPPLLLASHRYSLPRAGGGMGECGPGNHVAIKEFPGSVKRKNDFERVADINSGIGAATIELRIGR